MRMLKLATAVVAASLAFVPVAQAQGFIMGMVVGGILFGGNTQYGSSGGMILYSADEKVLKEVDPVAVRQVSKKACFEGSGYNYSRENSNKSLKELFEALMKTRASSSREQTILQIVRVFDPGTPECAAIWFAYIDKPQ